MSPSRAIQLAVGLMSPWLLCHCAAPQWQQAPHDVVFQRRPKAPAHARPAKSEVSEWWTTISYSTAAPLSRALNPGHWLQDLVGGRPALDTNHFGQVVDSSWFQNRLGKHALSPQDIARGPNQHEGPAPGPLVVMGGKLQGATPGLVVKDSRQDRYIIKFDPAAFPELASGAEVIATKVLWAAGYNVPQNYVMRFDLNRLRLSPDARTGGGHGEGVALTPERLRDLIAHVNPYPDGTIRALFSKLIEGEAIGPFAFQGRREDDPQDTIEHQRRRSLRGLWLLAAWLNNVDTRDANTYDVFIPSAHSPGLGRVQHYLLDFGDALGSAGTQPKYIGEGYEGRLDWPQMLRSLITAGLWYRYWLPVQRSPFRGVGVFEAQVFEPDRWRPNIPNPAFEESDPLDTYWAAALIARFDVEDLIEIVRQAKYSDPAAEAWILRVLLQRQYTILEWVFSSILPLDSPRVVDRYRVQLEDLAVRSALLTPGQVGYAWTLVWHGPQGPTELARGQNYRPDFDLRAAVQGMAATGADLTSHPFLSLSIERPLPTPDLPAMLVHLRVLPEGLLTVGLQRSPR